MKILDLQGTYRNPIEIFNEQFIAEKICEALLNKEILPLELISLLNLNPNTPMGVYTVKRAFEDAKQSYIMDTDCRPRLADLPSIISSVLGIPMLIGIAVHQIHADQIIPDKQIAKLSKENYIDILLNILQQPGDLDADSFKGHLLRNLFKHSNQSQFYKNFIHLYEQKNRWSSDFVYNKLRSGKLDINKIYNLVISQLEPYRLKVKTDLLNESDVELTDLIIKKISSCLFILLMGKVKIMKKSTEIFNDQYIVNEIYKKIIDKEETVRYLSDFKKTSQGLYTLQNSLKQAKSSYIDGFDFRPKFADLGKIIKTITIIPLAIDTAYRAIKSSVMLPSDKDIEQLNEKNYIDFLSKILEDKDSSIESFKTHLLDILLKKSYSDYNFFHFISSYRKKNEYSPNWFYNKLRKKELNVENISQLLIEKLEPYRSEVKLQNMLDYSAEIDPLIKKNQ